jgi:hypothetical protein
MFTFCLDCQDSIDNNILSYLSTCPKPTLTKFEGKWDQLSPKAQILVWLGFVASHVFHFVSEFIDSFY